MEEVIRKKVKLEETENFLGIELEPAEMMKLYTVVNTIVDYREESRYDLEHQKRSLKEVPEEVLALIPDLLVRQKRIQTCLDENYFFLKHLIGFNEVKKPVPNIHYPFNINRLEHLLDEVAREWSA